LREKYAPYYIRRSRAAQAGSFFRVLRGRTGEMRKHALNPEIPCINLTSKVRNSLDFPSLFVLDTDGI
jgi:hypothetical protein